MIITIPKPLREKLGEEATDSLVELLNKFEEKTKGDVISLSEEKYERRLNEEITKLDKRITEEVAKLDKKISEVKADIIKWMFIFWVGQIGALLGILFAFFKP